MMENWAKRLAGRRAELHQHWQMLLSAKPISERSDCVLHPLSPMALSDFIAGDSGSAEETQLCLRGAYVAPDAAARMVLRLEPLSERAPSIPGAGKVAAPVAWAAAPA